MDPKHVEINRKTWNERTATHFQSEFYDVPGFVAGKSSLYSIELDLLGDVAGKSILHLQCHFGQDTLSLARMGAQVTGVDLSDKAIDTARALAEQIGMSAQSTFICCNVYDLPVHLEGQFDIVFTSYGTITWLPDLDRWAAIVARYLKPGGRFVFAEFHPVVWMFDDDFKEVGYRYFNSGPIIETESGTYADRDADLHYQYVGWNHGFAEVLGSLLGAGIRLARFEEYDYSPHNCFRHTVEFAPGKFRIKHLGDRIPMVYGLVGER
jgi:SAM-dependent methyltransferase